IAVGCASAPHAPAFRVGIIGDQTLASNLNAAYELLEKGVARLDAEHVRVVLHTGDLVESCDSPEAIRATFARAAKILDRLASRWYMAVGDHDVSPRQQQCKGDGDTGSTLPRFVQDSTDRSRETLFKELYGATRAEAGDRLYY